MAALVKPQSTPRIFSPANPNHVTKATAALFNWFVCCLTFVVMLFLHKCTHPRMNEALFLL